MTRFVERENNGEAGELVVPMPRNLKELAT